MSARKNRRPKFKKLNLEKLEVRRVLASDWQNPGQPRDVSHDLVVSPIDALLGVNRLNSGVPRTFPARAANSTEPYYDVDGSGDHNPLDILLVINALNQRKPTAAVVLQNDTGSAVGATSDLRTTDLSVRGTISMVDAGELWGRFAGDSQWHDLTKFLEANQTFAISHTELLNAFGGAPNDGVVTLEFQPRWGAGNTATGNEVDLAVTYDTTPPQSNFEVQPNFLGAIVTPTSTTIEVPLGETASSFSLIPSRIRLFDATFDGLSDEPVALVPQGISFSGDGKSLLIDPPKNTNSISYRVSVGEDAFEDLAGNLNSAFDAIANHFSDSAQSPLTFNQRTEVSSLSRVVKEFTFNLTSPDLFILAGYSSTVESQIDLFAPSGRSLHTWSTGPTGGDLAMGSDNRVLMIESGEYRLRIAVPALNEVAFKALLGSTLPAIPTNLQLQGTFDWFELDALSITTTNQDRIYFENQLAPQTPFQVSLYTQYGQRIAGLQVSDGDIVFNVPEAGRYIAIVGAFAQNRPISYNFSVHLTATARQPLTFGTLHESTLTVPGQQVEFNFAAKAGHTYSLELDADLVDVSFSSPGTFSSNDVGPFAIVDSGLGSVTVALNRSDLTSAVARFRLIESVTIANPPTEPIVNTEQLQSGVTERTIKEDFESFVFTLTGAVDDLYVFQDLPTSSVDTYRLLAPSGTEIEPIEQADSLRVYRLPFDGQFRWVATGAAGSAVAFQSQKLSQANPLVSSGVVSGAFGANSFVAYEFTATEGNFFAFATDLADGLIWSLLDQDGRTVTSIELNEPMDVSLTVGRTYSLIVSKLNEFASNQFEFERRVVSASVQAIAIGETVSGNLTARGDRLVLEIPLTAGHLIQLDSVFDPLNLRVQWLDFSSSNADIGRDINPSVADRIGVSKTFRVLVQNVSDNPVAYSLTFNEAVAVQAPPALLQGFDTIRTGVVDTEVSFEFTASAGTLSMLDWLLEDDNQLSISITDASGGATDLSASDSPFALAEASGVIKVTISNFSGAPKPFSFRMLSPDTAPIISLGVQQTRTVVPFGASLFRVALSSATEIFLQSRVEDPNSTLLFRRAPDNQIGVPYEGPFFNAQFVPGEAFIWAANSTSKSYTSVFTAIDVASLTEAALNTVVDLPTEPAVTYLVPFSTTTSSTIIASGPFFVTDEAGDLIPTSLEGIAYQLPHAGKFRAIFTANATATSLEFHSQTVTSAVASIGQAMTGTIAKVGDVNRHTINLTAGSPIALTMSIGDNGFARWISPDGEVLGPISDGTTHLPVFLSGIYQLEFYSGLDEAKYRFELNDLSLAPSVSIGKTEGAINSGLIDFYRIAGQPNQLIELENQTVQPLNMRLVDRFGMPLSDVGFLNLPILQMPDEGIAYVAVELLPGQTASAYAFSIAMVTSTAKPATVGQVVSGSLATKYAGDEYAFTVSAPTWLRAASNATGPTKLVLSTADGAKLFGDTGFFEFLPAGDYKLTVYNTSQNPVSYALTIDLLSQTQVLPLNQNTSITLGNRYRIDVPAGGRYEVQLRDSSNNLLSAEDLAVTNVFGERIDFAPRGEFKKADSFWLSFAPDSDLSAGSYTVRVVPIESRSADLAVGTLGQYTLPANGLTEQTVTIRYTPGMRLVIEELELASGGSVEARLSDSIFTEWIPIEHLPSVLFNFSGSEKLELRFTGAGTVRVRVVDLNVASPLPHNSELSVELNARQRAHTWLIEPNVGDTITLLNQATTLRPALWMIIDEWGNTVAQSVSEPIEFSFVNKQRYALVIIATEPLVAPITVPFRNSFS